LEGKNQEVDDHPEKMLSFPGKYTMQALQADA
jgi:hypothetical protein